MYVYVYIYIYIYIHTYVDDLESFGNEPMGFTGFSGWLVSEFVSTRRSIKEYGSLITRNWALSLNPS